MSFLETIRREMKRRGLEAADLAKKAGVTERQVRHLLKKDLETDIRTVAAVAFVLGFRVDISFTVENVLDKLVDEPIKLGDPEDELKRVIRM